MDDAGLRSSAGRGWRTEWQCGRTAELASHKKLFFQTSIMFPVHSGSPCWQVKAEFSDGSSYETISIFLYWMIFLSYKSKTTEEMVTSISSDDLTGSEYLSVSIGHQSDRHDVLQHGPGGEELLADEESAGRTQTLIVQSDRHRSDRLIGSDSSQLHALLLNLGNANQKNGQNQVFFSLHSVVNWALEDTNRLLVCCQQHRSMHAGLIYKVHNLTLKPKPALMFIFLPSHVCAIWPRTSRRSHEEPLVSNLRKHDSHLNQGRETFNSTFPVWDTDAEI